MPTIRMLDTEDDEPDIDIEDVVASQLKISGRQAAAIRPIRRDLFTGQEVRVEISLAHRLERIQIEGAAPELVFVRPNRTQVSGGTMLEDTPGIYSGVVTPDTVGEWRAVVLLPDPIPSTPFFISRNPLGASVVPAGSDGDLWVEADSISVAGVDNTGPWIDSDSLSPYAGVDGTGPWIEE